MASPPLTRPAGRGPRASGGGAQPLTAGTARAPADAGASGHGPRAAGVGPRLCSPATWVTEQSGDTGDSSKGARLSGVHALERELRRGREAEVHRRLEAGRGVDGRAEPRLRREPKDGLQVARPVRGVRP